MGKISSYNQGMADSEAMLLGSSPSPGKRTKQFRVGDVQSRIESKHYLVELGSGSSLHQLILSSVYDSTIKRVVLQAGGARTINGMSIVDGATSTLIPDMNGVVADWPVSEVEPITLNELSEGNGLSVSIAAGPAMNLWIQVDLLIRV